MSLIPWNPYDVFERMRMDPFTMSFPLGTGFERPRLPAIDVKETDNEVIVTADVPGINPDDIDITVNQNGISIKGQSQQVKDVDERGYRMRERQFGAFQRFVPFPTEVVSENATASYGDGVLEIHAPKAQTGSKSIKLRIDQPPNRGRTQ